MLTFGKLLNIINEERETSHHEDSRKMRVIRTGLNISDEFWDEFMQVCNNSEDLAELLDVPSTTIIGWGSRIKDALNKVKHADTKGDGDKKVKSKVIDTGNFAGGIATGGSILEKPTIVSPKKADFLIGLLHLEYEQNNRTAPSNV